MLVNEDALCAKWMPREKSSKRGHAKKIRGYLGLSSVDYRKLLSSLSSTVEQSMCQNKWDEINYNHVPSQAARIYKKAFAKHDTERYEQYLNDLAIGAEGAKINAGAIFPHDIIKPLVLDSWTARNKPLKDADKILANAQWDALPDYMTDARVLPMVDSSASMCVNVAEGIQANHVAAGLGLYMAERNKGVMKDLCMTFSESPEFVQLKGDLANRVDQITSTNWDMNTNLEAAFDALLDLAVQKNVSQDEMPEIIMILSDMQFDYCTSDPSSTVMKMIKKRYKTAGYTMPAIVFWNINAQGTTPVKSTKAGTALVSGYSPSILKSLLSNVSKLTPINVMLETLMDSRYDY